MAFYRVGRTALRFGSPHSGFTLIELLIVVAIISILAAIAIPNYLEAQVRAKVARVRADMRTYATAIEIYRIDNDSYPSWEIDSSHNHHCLANGMMPGCNDPCPLELTTPIAYISSLLFNPFPSQRGFPNFEEITPGYHHHNVDLRYWHSDPEVVRRIMIQKWQGYTFGPIRNYSILPERRVGWEFWSWGPDMEDNGGQGCHPTNGYFGSWGGTYDASNGTISSGDIAIFGP